MAKAAVTRSIRDDHQKNFLKIFEGLTGKHSRKLSPKICKNLSKMSLKHPKKRLLTKPAPGSSRFSDPNSERSKHHGRHYLHPHPAAVSAPG